MNEPDAIKARHSVRNYQARPIESEKLDALRQMITQCNADGNLHLQLLQDAGNSFNRVLHKFTGLGTAPSAIACVGPDDETLDERCGYYGEKLVLLAQSLGLNSCWVGMYRKDGVPAEVLPGERLSIVIALGYGTDQGKPHKSRTPEQVIVNTPDAPEWFMKGVEAALLAPTAINQQKFTIELLKDGSVKFTDLGGPFSKVDFGIVKYHFEVGRKIS